LQKNTALGISQKYHKYQMLLSYWTLFVALSLSLVAAYYSIAGLTAIFATAVVPIIIMGAILEVGKVTVTIWLHEYWHRCRWLMKVYLVPAVFMLMVITSMGIFGFLSKAHMDQGMVSGDVAAKISIYDEKIKTSKENIDANRKALKQMDEAVDQVMGRSTTETGADKAVQIRRSQQKERTRLLAEIEAEQKKITALNEQRAPVAAEVRKVEAEVGPIKYIAALIYGDNPDANVSERAVRWVIIILVTVFDPLALMLVLASTESMKWERELKQRKPEEEIVAYEPDNGPLTQQQIDQLTESAADELPTGELVTKSELFPTDPAPPGWMFPSPGIIPDTPVDTVAEITQDPYTQAEDDDDDDFDQERDEVAKIAAKAWKSENPGETLKHQRQLLDQGRIEQLPWLSDEFKLQADNDTPPVAGSMRGFGTSYPINANKGDMWLRVDQMPSVLYKHNGIRWIEVDKQLSDQYAYDTAYIDHLIDKISTGEYDLDLLSDAERTQIEHRLTNPNE